MATAPTSPVLRYIRRIAASHTVDLSDGQLLDRFASRRDEAAFAALVRRHGPLVLSVCRRVLADWHAADDAFQDTFLVLAHKADALERTGSLGPWLYGVAYRTALKARTRAARRRGHERQAAAARPAAASAADPAWADLLPALDEAVAALPEKYRAALVLCAIEGKTMDEAARLLGCPRGTVGTRLARARARLRRRLTGRGLSLPAGLLAVALPSGARAEVPAALADSTIRVMKGVLKAMSLTKLKVALLILTLGVAGATVVSRGVAGGAREDGAGTKAWAGSETAPAYLIEPPDVLNLRADKTLPGAVHSRKVYYLVIAGAGTGLQSYRLPLTGVETVLDALGGLPDLRARLSSSTIRVVRRGAGAGTRDQTLPVDWRGITQQGATKTNYLLLPGDRICVALKNVRMPVPDRRPVRVIDLEKTGPQQNPLSVRAGVSYARLFGRALAAVEDLLGVAYANRFEGRIESAPTEPGLKPESRRRRAVVSISCRKAGGYEVGVRVLQERRARGTDPAVAGNTWQPDGRDNELEQVILRRLARMSADPER